MALTLAPASQHQASTNEHHALPNALCARSLVEHGWWVLRKSQREFIYPLAYCIPLFYWWLQKCLVHSHWEMSIFIGFECILYSSTFLSISVGGYLKRYSLFFTVAAANLECISWLIVEAHRARPIKSSIHYYCTNIKKLVKIWCIYGHT